MVEQPRKYGMFTAKGTSERKVRSLRATDEVWEFLGAIAGKADQTIADWIDWLVTNEYLDSLQNQLWEATEENALYKEKIQRLQAELENQEGDNGALHLQILNLKDKLEHPEYYPDQQPQPRITPLEAIAILTEAIKLPANKGGAIKAEIKRAIQLLEAE